MILSVKLDPPTQDLMRALSNQTADPEAYSEWLTAFSEYNKANGTHLHMRCKPCYMRVYLWWKKAVLDAKE